MEENPQIAANSWEYAAAFVGVTALGGVVAGIYTDLGEGAAFIGANTRLLAFLH